MNSESALVRCITGFARAVLTGERLTPSDFARGR